MSYKVLEYEKDGVSSEALIRKAEDSEEVSENYKTGHLEFLCFNPVGEKDGTIILTGGFKKLLPENVKEYQVEKCSDCELQSYYENFVQEKLKSWNWDDPYRSVRNNLVKQSIYEFEVSAWYNEIIVEFKGNQYTLKVDQKMNWHGVSILPTEKSKSAKFLEKKDYYLRRKASMDRDLRRRELLSGYAVGAGFIAVFLIPVLKTDAQFSSVHRILMALAIVSIFASAPVFLLSSSRRDHVLGELDKRVASINDQLALIQSEYTRDKQKILLSRRKDFFP